MTFYSFVYDYQGFTLKTETAGTTGTLISYHETTRCHESQDRRKERVGDPLTTPITCLITWLPRDKHNTQFANICTHNTISWNFPPFNRLNLELLPTTSILNTFSMVGRFLLWLVIKARLNMKSAF
jgi:hypothetical protein